MECGYAICSTFLPGDRHVVVGTKEGKLLLFDVAASALIATIDAHEGPVWGIHVRPDGQALVSGSADKDVKFWEFEMRESGEGEKVISRLGVETVVSLNFFLNLANATAQNKAAYACPCPHTENDRRRPGRQVQSRRSFPRRLSPRFNCQGLLPGHAEILPFPLRSQTSCSLP